MSGQLTRPDERHWYAVDAKRGEVLWIEALGERINSPVDLDVSIFKPDGTTELARFSDHFNELGDTRFPLQHLDPAGRWVAESDGRFLILVRNLIGGLDDDPRRVYCLCVRREEPDVHVVLLPGEGLGKPERAAARPRVGGGPGISQPRRSGFAVRAGRQFARGVRLSRRVAGTGRRAGEPGRIGRQTGAAIASAAAIGSR